ncbi:MAG: hypothetical protein DRP18_02945, partial [Candidatus Aenigmatarchaeota archaeon]
MYAKYVRRGRKKYGPYYYKSIRTPEGKVKNIYLGKEKPKKGFNAKDRKNLVKLVLVFLFISFFLLGFSFTGKFLGTFYTVPVNITFNRSSEFVWSPETQGEITSLKVSGFFSGNGTAKIFLKTPDKKLLVLDTKSVSSPGVSVHPGITGFVIKLPENKTKPNFTAENQTIQPLFKKEVDQKGADRFQMTIESPLHSLYNSSLIYFNVSVTLNNATCVYSLDNTANKTMKNDTDRHFYSLENLSDGYHSVVFYCNNSFLQNHTQASFITDTQPPDIAFVSPSPLNEFFINNTYVQWNYSSSENLSFCILSINQTNYTKPATQNFCYFNLTLKSNQTYCLTGFASDTAGNWNQTETVCINVFYIKPEPELSVVWKSPENNSVTNKNWIYWEFEVNKKPSNCTLLIASFNYTMNINDTVCFFNLTNLSDNLYQGNVSVEFPETNLTLQTPSCSVVLPKNFTIPQNLSFSLLLLPPTPENHSVLQEPNLTLSLTSNFNLSSCSLLFNQTRIKMNL